MVLDSRALEWAGQHGLDTATLKKAKVPIYGKWYFPELPADVPLVNLQTGQVETFGPGFRAGAILYVKEEDLKRARLGPYAAPPEPKPAPAPAAPAAAPVAAATAVETPTPERPTTERTLGTDEVEEAAAVAPVEPSAVPTMPAVGEQQPVRMLHDEDRAAAAAEHDRPVTSHAAHDQQETGHASHGAHPSEHAHPQPNTYIVVALILAVITAIEVAVYYIPALFAFIVPILLVLSAAKFVMVVGWFMHLKFDHNLYTGFFGGGLLIAISVFLGMCLMFLVTPVGGGN